MQIKCPQCAKVIPIPVGKLPAGKEKAGVKCPGCGKTLVFKIPENLRNQGMEKTIVDDNLSVGVTIDQSGQAFLLALKGPNEGKVYELKEGSNVLGRLTASNHPEIPVSGDALVSRKHCLIEMKQKENGRVVLISDDGSLNGGSPSANGTFLLTDNYRLSKWDKLYLKPGDQICVGETELEFQISE